MYRVSMPSLFMQMAYRIKIKANLRVGTTVIAVVHVLLAFVNIVARDQISDPMESWKQR